MILKLLPISLLQCMLLTGGQVLMKYGLLKAGAFSFSWGYFGKLLINWQFICCGICFAVGSVLWMYIINVSYNDIFNCFFAFRIFNVY